jgi:hypothetical protein
VQTLESESAASMCKVCYGFLSLVLSLIKVDTLFSCWHFFSVPRFQTLHFHVDYSIRGK